MHVCTRTRRRKNYIIHRSIKQGCARVSLTASGSFVLSVRQARRAHTAHSKRELRPRSKTCSDSESESSRCRLCGARPKPETVSVGTSTDSARVEDRKPLAPSLSTLPSFPSFSLSPALTPLEQALLPSIGDWSDDLSYRAPNDIHGILEEFCQKFPSSFA